MNRDFHQLGRDARFTKLYSNPDPSFKRTSRVKMTVRWNR